MIRRFWNKGGAIRSLASLFSAQGLGFAVTVIQVPYLTRALLPAGYGVYAFCNVLILVATHLIGYAANNSGVVRFQRYQASPVRRSLVFWSQVGVQLILATLSSLAILALAFANPGTHGEFAAYMMLIPFCVANAIYCPWVLSALGRFQQLSAYTMALRLSSLALVLLLVRDQSDIMLAVSTVVLPNVAVTIAFVALLWRKRIVMWIPPAHWDVTTILRRDLYIALSTYVIIVQANLPILAAKFILPPVDYGLLAFADRFRTISQMVVGTFGLVLFSRYAGGRLSGAIPPARAKRAILTLVGMGTMTGGSIVVLCPWVISFLGGAKFTDAYWPTIIIGLTVPVAALNYYLSFFVIALFGLAKQQTANLLGLTLISAAILATPWIAHAWTVAALVLGVETMRAIAALLLLRRRGVSFLHPAPPTS